MATNELIDDAFIDFLLFEVLDGEGLCKLRGYEHHSRETFDLYMNSVRRLARQDLFPTYRPMDQNPPVFRDGRVHTHPSLPALWKAMVELGLLTATRPEEVGGQSLPLLVQTLATAYPMAANLSAYGYVGLTTGAAQLIEAFGSQELKKRFMTRMYEGEWTGTMALTEPQAGSSLADLTTRARPTDDDYYLLKGSKIFISGADQQITDNVVIAWQWLKMSAAAKSSARLSNARSRGTLSAAQYWICTELPRVAALAELCRTNERSYLDAQPEWF